MAERRNTILLVVVVVAILWIGIRSQSKPGTTNSASRGIEVGELRLVDNKGVERALLGLSEEGSVSLRLSDKKGKPHAILSVRSEGETALSLIGSDDKLQMQLSLVGSNPIVRLYSPRGKVADFAGRERLALAVPADGGPMLLMKDNDGRPRTALGVTGAGTAGVIVFGKDGGVWTAPPIKTSTGKSADNSLSKEVILEMLKAAGADMP